ncbi:MAG: hypothetical protein QXK37_04785 [Candidatus Woesearchaeota archaeon]
MSTKPKIIEEKEITMAELKEHIDSIKKRDGELNFRSAKTEEYLSLFVNISAKESREMTEKIAKLNVPRLKEAHIVKIIDLMPKTIDDLKIIMQSYTLSVSEDNLRKILEIVQEYLPKKKK